ncbi:site-specific integrase [Pseudomonas sp. PA1(2017)]|uniref:site-specific integrase n=1 Tax=Pseudomonas sp. PA1(2017) TaxID=1932113 RepID=UPI001115456F|nr:site-specific integrase [Pseudomonas sp. PA1(2017)]
MKYQGSTVNPNHSGQIETLSEYELSRLRYPEQRAFLNKIKAGGGFGDPQLDCPDWLVDGCNFNSPKWLCSFGGGEKRVSLTVDFDVALEDGSTLLASKNSELLRSIKLFLCFQIHTRFNGGKRKEADVEADIFKWALKFVDFLLLNATNLRVSELKFGLVTKSLLVEYLAGSIGYPSSTCLYDYPRRLAIFLKSESSTISEQEISEARASWPTIDELPSINDRSLDLSDDELLRARVYIVSKGLYSRQYGVIKYNSRPFLNSIYRNTLMGRALVPKTFSELNESIVHGTEYAAVPVRNTHSLGISEKILSRNIKVLKRLALVQNMVPTASVDVDMLSKITLKQVVPFISKSEKGRFRTLPGQVVFDLMRDSYEHIVKHSKSTLTDIILWCLANHRSEIKASQAHRAMTFEASPADFMHRKASSGRWLITYSMRPENYFELYRTKPASYDSYRILMGGYLSVIGALTARRQDELLGLQEKTCLHPNKNPYLQENKAVNYQMTFKAGKTGNNRSRKTVRVPIPMMVARLLWDLKEFHCELVRFELIKKDAPLLLYVQPDDFVIKPMDATLYNNCLNAICDYVETPVVLLEGGLAARFYVRQHQLRRFFALVFFHSSGFKALDSLRAFLGHSDILHLYTYILEVVPGSMLDTVKADSLADAVFSENVTVENLNVVRGILCETLGVGGVLAKSPKELAKIAKQYMASESSAFDVTAFSYEEVQFNIEALIRAKVINLQPERLYFQSDEGASGCIRLVVKVG